MSENIEGKVVITSASTGLGEATARLPPCKAPLDSRGMKHRMVFYTSTKFFD